MKKGISIIIAMILIVMMTIVAASAAYYWLTELQVEMQGGTESYRSDLTEQITGRLHIIDFQYNANNNYARVTMTNIGSRNVEGIGSSEDYLIIYTGTSSCYIGFNSSTCDKCPFDLDVNEVIEFTIDVVGTDCANLVKGTEYDANFILKDGQAETSFIPPPIDNYNIWVQKNPSNKPSNRKKHAMATIYGTDKIMLHGGSLGAALYSNETWIYDLSDEKWVRMAAGSPSSSPSAREDHAMAAIDGTDKVVLHGGFDNSGNCDDSGSTYCNGTWVYDYSDDDWTRMSPAIKPGIVKDHIMATIYGTDKVVLFGGDNTSSPLFSDTWIYELGNNSWTQMSPTSKPSNRTEHAMATVDENYKIILFGGDIGLLMNNDTWIYFS